jgi:hypothetical protein
MAMRAVREEAETMDSITQDVVLAEYAGQAWLVRGEQHIDDLLANTLDPDISIAVIACESKSAVDEMWRQWNDSDDLEMMWLIHPAIVNRARGRPGEVFVTFAAWSAALDDAAQRILKSTAGLVQTRPGSELRLAYFTAEDAPAIAAQMAELRCGLLEAQLHALGVTVTARENRTLEKPEDADRIIMVVKLRPPAIEG